MNVRTTLPLIALTIALQPAHVSAQNTISYETGEYEYAQALPELDDDVVTETIEAAAADQPVGAARSIPARAETPVFVRSPTIQPIDPSQPEYYVFEQTEPQPAPAARSIQNRSAVPAVQQAQPTYVYIQQPPQVVYVYPAQQGMVTQAAGGASRVIYRDGSAGGAQPQYAGGYQPAPNATSVYLPAGSQVVDFDRNAWIEECRARLDTYENDSERGEIIGALLGGAAGGLLGNRIAGSGNRTAGTLIGAGAGALAGMAAGDAIEDGSRRRSDSRSQCQAYLDDYMQRATADAGATQYNQPGQYMLVPVTVEVPQMSVYRDGTPAN